MDALLTLCRKATPKQLNMITAMIRSAIEAAPDCVHPISVQKNRQAENSLTVYTSFVHHIQTF